MPWGEVLVGRGAAELKSLHRSGESIQGLQIAGGAGIVNLLLPMAFRVRKT
jgi:hypothetical protein